jgi:hypothetical protein
MQPLDRQRVVGRFRQDCQGKFAHLVPISIWVDSGPSPVAFCAFIA